LAELKLEIEKLEVESCNSKKRINQLENYLMMNGISLPIDNDIDFTIPQKELDKIDKNYERINTFDQIELENKLKLIEIEKENMTLKLIEAFDKMTDNNDISLVDKVLFTHI
jgi:4-hydroxy-3-methylbut-2-en-1-yl diphosphate synthase IspG/GcpE